MSVVESIRRLATELATETSARALLVIDKNGKPLVQLGEAPEERGDASVHVQLVANRVILVVMKEEMEGIHERCDKFAAEVAALFPS